MSLDKLSKSTVRYIRTFLETLSCARALTVWLLFINDEHDQLVSLLWDPNDYNQLSDARDSLAATKFLSKATFLNTSFDVREEALANFLGCEESCRNVNMTLDERLKPFSRHAFAMSVEISRILSDFTAEEFVSGCGWGPGATLRIKRREANVPIKFLKDSEITPQALDFIEPWFSLAFPIWKCEFEITCSSKVVTVPKNAKTDRTICIEPGMNMFFQKGVGSLLRRRLRDSGIDLSCQSINAERSRIGSKFNHLATVDFSSASDTISRSIVWEFLPSRWYNLLWAFRVNSCVLDGRTIKLEKFSSMGNGFTFELETLIFYCAALACCKLANVSTKGVSVYGDDVIIPSEVYSDYVAFTSALGFTVNQKKSYSSGYYRESCGAHWWDGVSIKPIFLKEEPKSIPDLIKFANSIRRYAHDCHGNLACDIRFKPLWLDIVYSDALRDVSHGPEGYGDCVIIDNYHHFPYVLRHPHYEGYIVKYSSYDEDYLRDFDHEGVLLAKLYELGLGYVETETLGRVSSHLNLNPRPCLFMKNKYPLARRTARRRRRLVVPVWYDLGDWL